MAKRTPLYNRHLSLQGKMVDFAGYELPVQYSSIIKEHLAVREQAGVFDVSHMGEFMLEGARVIEFMDHLLPNKYYDLADKHVRYSPMLNNDGGIVDDLLVYKFNDHKVMLVVNAANKEKDWNWITKNIYPDIRIEDFSDSCAQLALQGPKSKEIISKLIPESELPQKYYTFNYPITLKGEKCLISYTGYTGEDGCEIYMPNEIAEYVLDQLLSLGKDEGILPCGLGCRDTLRLEAAMPLYGHEMNDEISPLEAGLKHFIHLEKENFIGKEGLIKKGEPKLKRIGIKAIDRGILREQDPIYLNNRKIGETTSGSYLPYLKGSYALCLVNDLNLEVGDQVECEVRGKRLNCEVVKLPFYTKKKGEK